MDRKSLLLFKAEGIVPLDSERLECHPKHSRRYKLKVSEKKIEMEMSIFFFREDNISILEKCILKRSLLA